jgi:predicted TIM-barrel fold metal-dependent hydrolase
MDREGVDAQVLYGSMTLSFETLLDRDLAIACMRAYNDYIADDCRNWAGRLFPVGFVSLVDVGAAVAELRRCVEDLGMIGVHVAPSLPVPHPAAPDAFPQIRLPKHISHPDFHPILAAAVELDVAIGVHGSPGVYLPSGIAEQVDCSSSRAGHRTRCRWRLGARVRGRLRRHPRLRAASQAAAVGWPIWRTPTTSIGRSAFATSIRTKVPQGPARELPRARAATQAHVLQVKQAYGPTGGRRRQPASDRDAFIHEYANLKHDPSIPSGAGRSS